MNDISNDPFRELRLALDAGALDYEQQLPDSMRTPARRVRRAFMRLGQLISVAAFVVIGGDVLFEQWIAGHVSPFFIFGTACLIAAACTALFAVIAMLGLVTSSVFSDEPPRVGPRQLKG